MCQANKLLIVSTLARYCVRLFPLIRLMQVRFNQHASSTKRHRIRDNSLKSNSSKKISARFKKQKTEIINWLSVCCFSSFERRLEACDKIMEGGGRDKGHKFQYYYHYYKERQKEKHISFIKRVSERMTVTN